MGSGKDRLIAAAMVVAVLVLWALAAAAGGRAGGPVAGIGAGETLPPGWSPVGGPISAVTYPVQVLAVASFPVRPPAEPRGCRPAAVLRRMPADGVLLQVVEYAPRSPAGKPLRVPRLPHRPRRFSYADATFARFECAGPSYKFAFEERGRAFQAQVWMRPHTVDPRRRAEALRILDRF